MRTIWRSVLYSLAAASLFFTINFSWSHAAIAWMMTGDECPENLVLQAKVDALKLFQTYTASPLWLCLPTPLLGLDVSHGTTRIAPFLPAIIVIGPSGLKRNVMAHEYGHAELAARTSTLLRTYLIPTWFDEGLAMQIDGRKGYSTRNLVRYLKRPKLSKPQLDHLGWSREFFRGGSQEILHYAFARCVVKRWLKAEGPTQPLDLINKVGWLKPFPYEQFRKYERLCLKI